MKYALHFRANVFSPMPRILNVVTFLFAFLPAVTVFGQAGSFHATRDLFPSHKLTIEPALGINPMPMSDIVLSNLVQWNVKKHLHLVARSSVSFNTAFGRNFNYIRTDYSYSLSQTVGIGTSLYLKRSSHSFSFMAGVKYDATKETLVNPDFEQVSLATRTVSPDFGLLYNLKMGRKNPFFSFRMYVPLYPYPFKTKDISAIDGNMANLSLEFGVGFRIR